MTTNTENKVTYETYTMTEAQAKKLVRNTLMVAGKEMGKKGDHWPVIKNTITDIMMDWEKLETEREVDAVMKVELYKQLEIFEDSIKKCTPEDRVQAKAIYQRIKDIFDAYFTEPEIIEISADNENEDKPIHIKRAEAIIATLEEENDYE